MLGVEEAEKRGRTQRQMERLVLAEVVRSSPTRRLKRSVSDINHVLKKKRFTLPEAFCFTRVLIFV